MTEFLRENLISHAMSQNEQLKVTKKCIDAQNFDHAKSIIDAMTAINRKLINGLTT